MYHIEYAALNYYLSSSLKPHEGLCVGVLFHNTTTRQVDFKYISNFKIFHAFDDEADIDFVKLYLKGIKNEIDNYNNKEFDLASYIKSYANEFRFSVIIKFSVDENINFIEDLSRLYLKYDRGEN